LNIGALVGAFTGDYLGIIGNLFPFLFPSNWFKWKASKEMAEAERKSFASLRGNEMNAVESLYFLILRDQEVLAQVDQHLAWMRRTQEELKKEEEAEALPAGSAEYFGTSVAQLERDRVILHGLIQNEYGELAQAVALPPLSFSRVVGLDFPTTLEGVRPINAQEFFRDAQLKSHEVQAMGYLQKAAKLLTVDVFFEFLDPSAGASIGFGTAGSFRIGKSREHELKIRTDELYSLIEMRAGQVANEHNTALERYTLANTGGAATQKRLAWLFQRHLNGDSTLDETDFIAQLVELQFKMIGFGADRASAIAAWQMSKARMQRLLLQGYYQNLEDALPAMEDQGKGRHHLDARIASANE
jgi:hypothetical protein